MNYAGKLEEASLAVIESGLMTGDLAAISTLPDIKTLDSESFIKAIRAKLAELLA